MRVLILLIVVLYCSFVNSTLLQGNLYFSADPCSSSESSTTSECPSEAPSGFVAKEDACIYMHGISDTYMSFNVSSNGAVVESIYEKSDYFCKNPSVQFTINTNTCYQKCTSVNYLYDVKPVESFEYPNSILTINSKSSNCKNDWQSTYNFIQYYKLKTCVPDLSGKGSFMLDCEGGGMTVYSFSGTVCDTTPHIYYLPLHQTDCQQYQVCNK